MYCRGQQYVLQMLFISKSSSKVGFFWPFSGGLFNLAVRLMQLFSEDDNTNYVELTSLLGLYFQGQIETERSRKTC